MVRDRDALQRRLRGLFVQELEENLRTLTRGLLRLEEGNVADVHELFRCAHGLKGAAHAAGVAEAVDICDRMESAFAALRDGDLAAEASVIADLLTDVDALEGVAILLNGGAAEGQTFAGESGRSMGPNRQAAETMPRVVQDGAIRTHRSDGLPRPTDARQSVRVAIDKIDALLAATSESLASSQRLAVLSSEAVTAGDSVDTWRRRWRAILTSMDVTATPAEIRQLDELVDEASTRVATVVQSVISAQRAIAHGTTAVADAAQRLRLQPVADAFEGLDRIVHDVAAAQEKRARLSVHAGNMQVDRAVVAALRDPLSHLVRNAVDHGVEPSDERVAHGKPPVASVTVSAELRDNVVTVVVGDDGRGIDVDALRAAAKSRGLKISSASLEVAFMPGVSTAATVTAVSGRGVGLDAVRARLEQIGGTVEMSTEPGEGTTITLTAPTTFTTMRVLLAEAAGEIVGLPVVAIERVTTIKGADIRDIEGQSVINVDGDTRQAVSLAKALGFEGNRGQGENLPVALTDSGKAALVVDRFIADAEVVVKPAPRRVETTAGALGVAVLPKGEAALIINPAALLRAAAPAVIAERANAEAPPRRRVLLAEDTVTTRALERSILEAAGYDVVTAVDGLHAWHLLASEEVDLVVTDVHMPGMDGLALCEAIRTSPALSDLPVILVTSLASDRDRQRGADAGADAYLVKSEFQQVTLLDTIQRLL